MTNNTIIPSKDVQYIQQHNTNSIHIALENTHSLVVNIPILDLSPHTQKVIHLLPKKSIGQWSANEILTHHQRIVLPETLNILKMYTTNSITIIKNYSILGLYFTLCKNPIIQNSFLAMKNKKHLFVIKLLNFDNHQPLDSYEQEFITSGKIINPNTLQTIFGQMNSLTPIPCISKNEISLSITPLLIQSTDPEKNDIPTSLAIMLKNIKKQTNNKLPLIQLFDQYLAFHLLCMIKKPFPDSFLDTLTSSTRLALQNITRPKTMKDQYGIRTGYTIPIVFNHTLSSIIIWIYSNKNDSTNTQQLKKNTPHKHLLIECYFSNLGLIQLDIKTQTSNLFLTILSTKPIDLDTKNGISILFKKELTKLQWTGTLRYKTINPSRRKKLTTS